MASIFTMSNELEEMFKNDPEKKDYGWTTASIKPEYLKLVEVLSGFHGKYRSQMLHSIIVLFTMIDPVEREAMLNLAEIVIREHELGMSYDFDEQLVIPDDVATRIAKDVNK